MVLSVPEGFDSGLGTSRLAERGRIRNGQRTQQNILCRLGGFEVDFAVIVVHKRSRRCSGTGIDQLVAILVLLRRTEGRLGRIDAERGRIRNGQRTQQNISCRLGGFEVDFTVIVVHKRLRLIRDCRRYQSSRLNRVLHDGP